MHCNDVTGSADNMFSLLREISALPRMINSPGLDSTFDIVRRELPRVTIHEYPSGTECEDWIVPLSWRVTKGTMTDKSGREVASIDQSLLFVVPFSEPVKGWFTKQEIGKHLSTRPDRPEAYCLEHRNAYNYRLVDWGITLPHNLWKELPEGEYHVEIEVKRQPGSMKVAEYFLSGEQADTICICAHIDELCNDDLSGCVVAIELMKYIEQLAKRQYSYQMLLVPEMLGPIFFANSAPEKIKNTVSMLNLETVGAGAEWCLKKPLREGRRIEKALRAAMVGTGTIFRELGFFEGYGNDERVYAWPTMDIPGVALQRFPFTQYHTSEDTPGIITVENLMEALHIVRNFVKIVEDDYIPAYVNKFQPWLTRHDLYYDATRNADYFRKLNNIILYNIDGCNSVLDLSCLSGLDFFVVAEYLNKFSDHGLISKTAVEWKR